MKGTIMHSSSTIFARAALAWVLPLVWFAGCGGGEPGPTRAAVQGTVHYEGAPLAKGVIRFVPVEGTEGPKTSAPIDSGAFELPADLGPLVGSHRVEIESISGDLAPDDEQAIARLREAGVRRIEVLKLPAVYNQRSKLTATIRADEENSLTFALNAKGD